jgi:chromate reductase
MLAESNKPQPAEVAVSETFKFVAVSGSLRKGSYNSAILRAARRLAPEGVTIEIAEIGDLPLYNEDIRPGGTGFPPTVQAFREKLAGADAFLFAIPEYNYAISSPLKNAIDWASRPPNLPLAGKVYAMLSVSGGLLGGSRGQMNMRQIMVSCDGLPLNKPQVFIGGAKDKFDAELNFTDKAGQDLIRELLANAVALARQLKK